MFYKLFHPYTYNRLFSSIMTSLLYILSVNSGILTIFVYNLYFITRFFYQIDDWSTYI